jgi:hypothetical protein
MSLETSAYDARRGVHVYACLVHENFDCIVDLIQNLHYFDPDAAILL